MCIHNYKVCTLHGIYFIMDAFGAYIWCLCVRLLYIILTCEYLLLLFVVNLIINMMKSYWLQGAAQICPLWFVCLHPHLHDMRKIKEICCPPTKTLPYYYVLFIFLKNCFILLHGHKQYSIFKNVYMTQI